MKVNKHGDIIKKRTHKFKCYNCGCKYTANTGEWKYCSEYGDPSDKPTDYVSCDCPECGKSTRIQWRGKLRDWCEAHADLILLFVSLIMFLLFFVFVGTEHNVMAIISLFISVMSLRIIFVKI